MEVYRAEPEKRSRKDWFLLLLLLLFFLFTLWAGRILVTERTILFGRAFSPGTPSPQTRVEIDNAYLFASPLQAKANGQEKIRVTVFILDEQGLGVAGEVVSLGKDERLQTQIVQAATDELGRAIFDLSSQNVGDYLLEARVGSQVIPQRVTIKFR